MHVCEMYDIPGRSVAISSTCTTNLERFDEIRTRCKYDFEIEFLEMVSHLLGGIIIYKRNWSVEFLDKLRYIYIQIICRILSMYACVKLLR